AVGAAFDAHRVCWGPYRSFRGLVEEDPRVDPDRNPMWALVEQPGIGTYPAPGSPLSFSSLPRVPVTAAPRLGADTGDVLAEVLDLGEEDLAALRGAGTI
ncbi:MAG: 2-methylfumaryl-CoA isomerase, partial [Actinobacteria bacterium]|nr:2-methylfumaryl-CoA isomerase [Actinomycetota bacterium]NIS31998.1 2-methylfumaryl-CoA isomerase [Actinomycetota bacterium]